MFERIARGREDEDVRAPQVTVEGGVGSIACDSCLVNVISASVERHALLHKRLGLERVRRQELVNHRRVQGVEVCGGDESGRQRSDASRRRVAVIYRSAKRTTVVGKMNCPEGKKEEGRL